MKTNNVKKINNIKWLNKKQIKMIKIKINKILSITIINKKLINWLIKIKIINNLI